MNRFPLLDAPLLEKLNVALHYMNMAELKDACLRLHLPALGKKGELISRIITYIKTGTITTIPEIPNASKAKRHGSYPLAPTTLMLYGNYKNDLVTRMFLKKLVGNHFHFTAFGIDWLNERWLQGNPPTYQEFATFWQQETDARTLRKATPKKEWAYINFIQKYIELHPTASHKTITSEWKKFREQQVSNANSILKAFDRK